MKCSSCNSTSIDLEHGDWVCSDCGLAVERKGQFVTSVDTDELTYVNNNFFDEQNVPNDVKRSICQPVTARAAKSGLERAKRIGEYFNFTGTMLKNVTDIYQSLVESSKFIRKFFKSKLILGGVVILIVANRAGLIIPMEKICERVGCYTSELKAVLNMVLEANPSLKPSPKPMSDSIPFIVNEAKFENSEVETIKERCKMLVQLISESNKMDGKNPTYIIHAALCLTWKSIKPKERGIAKITFKKFCSRCSIPYSDTGNQRFKELNGFTTVLVTYLPWNKLSLEMIKVNMAFHLVDLLNHSRIVLHRYEEANRPSVEVKIQETSNLMASYKPFVLPAEEPEISDKEIQSYIRSDKEIKLIENLHRGIESTVKT